MTECDVCSADGGRHESWTFCDGCDKCGWSNAEIRRGQRWTQAEVDQMMRTAGIARTP